MKLLSHSDRVAHHQCQRCRHVHVYNGRSKLSEKSILWSCGQGWPSCRATRPWPAYMGDLPKLARPLSIPELLRHLIRIERKMRGRLDLVSVHSAQETVTIGRTHPPSPARHRSPKALAPHPIELP